MSDHIQIERHGAVQTIRMNRPDKKNALTRAMYAAMTKAIIEGDADASDSALMCSLACPGHFHPATTCRISWPLPQPAIWAAKSLTF